MLAAEESQDRSLSTSKIATAKNIYWLETTFYSFKCNFETLNLHDYFKSQLFRIPTLEEDFFFKAGKSSLTSFSIQLHRVLVNPDKRPDDGLCLNIWFTLLNSQLDPEFTTMNHRDDFVNVSYGLDIMNLRDSEWCNLKCVVKLAEKTCLQNELHDTQNGLIKHLTRKSDTSGRKAREMAFLLKRKSLNDVFSGRQQENFSNLKTRLIERTLGVVNEIARKFEMKVKKMLYSKDLDLGVYLDYIHMGYITNVHGICKNDSASLYLDAHRYGLDYLKIECREFMLKNLDSEFIVDVLTVSDIVQDDTLMNKALDVYWTNKSQVLKSDRWMDFAINNIMVVRDSILDASLRKWRSAVRNAFCSSQYHIEGQKILVVDDPDFRNVIFS